MEDLKKLDSLTEFQMTNAIQKAASQALASDQDRSEILANHLIKDNVPKELTKLATQAFNRRISVTTIGRRSEDTKADDFPLADFNKVASLRGCEESIKKSASVKAPFVFNVHKAEMKKAAAYKPLEVPQKQVTPAELLQKLESYMIKQEALFQEQINSFQKEQEQLDRMVKKASEMLSREPKTGRLLATVYGDTYTELFEGKLPEEALKKHAAYAVLPKSATVEYIEKTIEQADRVSTKSTLLELKKQAMIRLAKEAPVIEEKIKKAMLQKEAGAGYSMLKDIASNAVSVPINAFLAGTKGAVGQAEDLLGRSAPFLSPEKSYSPEDAISLALLSKDRYQDKRMRLIDMLASPELAQYPAGEIEKAVEDTIATNQAMSSPKMREYLKTEVIARLLAGNRTNRADQAAAADILKKVTETEANAKKVAPETAVAALSDKTVGGADKSLTKVLPSLSSNLDKLVGSKLMDKDLGKDWDAVRDEYKSDLEFRKAVEQKEKENKLKAVEGYMAAYNKAIAGMIKNKPAIDAFVKYNAVEGSGKRISNNPKDWDAATLGAFYDFQKKFWGGVDQLALAGPANQGKTRSFAVNAATPEERNAFMSVQGGSSNSGKKKKGTP